ncbi:MAG: right-handed parallel beta-helix repeat-containing protein [Phycisphaerales bacterium]|nr:right-handed parallel beta-helix repeat-containing protein [Phycisphaerales bacterium]
MARSRCQHVAFRAVVVIIALLLSGSDALAQRILRVPSEYPTIQAGIDAAEANDTVLVAPGDYAGPGNVDLDFLGKAITVRGENGLARINDSAGGAVAVRFQSGEPSQAVFEGFIIHFEIGAGIVIEGSSPTIRNCTLNVGQETPLSMTGSDSVLSDLAIIAYRTGPRVAGGRPTLERVAVTGADLAMSGTTATLRDCSVSNNTSGLTYTGGGISIRDSSATLTRCTIRGNVTFGDEGYDSHGGGVYVEGSAVQFLECTILANEAIGHHRVVHGEGGGAYLLNSEAYFRSCELMGNTGTLGGGVYVEGGSASFINCSFMFNTAWIYGGGACGNGDFENCLFELNWAQEAGGGASSNHGTYLRCTFRNNRATRSFYEEGFGGGLRSDNGPSIVLDCLFDHNSVTGQDTLGGGMYAAGSDVIRGCTFVSNYSEGAGGGIYFSVSQATLADSVVWENADGRGLNQILGDAVVTWSNIQGGYSGEGNIDLNPRFVDPGNGDYRLGDGSPCIDAGNNALVPPESEFDLDGLPRFVNDLGMPDMGEGTAPIVDMGCYEFQSTSTGLNLALRTSCPDGGSARIGWANGSPDRTAVLLISPGTGTIRIPNRYPCAGTELGLASTGLRIAWQGSNDADGGRVLNTTAPPGACGQFVQLLDVSTCNVSDVVPIE